MCRYPKYSEILKYGKAIALVSSKAPVAPHPPVTISHQPKLGLDINRRRGRDTGSGVVFPAVWIENKISGEVESFNSKKIHGTYRAKLNQVAQKFKELMKERLPGSKVWMTGSFAAGIELDSSDLDFTLEIPLLNGNPFKKLMYVKNTLKDSTTEFDKFYVVGGNIPVLTMVHKETKVEIDVTIDNDAPKRNTQLLVWYSQVDERFQPLCRAVKHWASKTGVEGSKFGRLNSFSLCLMLISYLQKGVTPAILPNIQELFPELNGEIQIGNDNYNQRNLLEEMKEQGIHIEFNNSSLGSLFLGFLKYYANFDFMNKWISIKRGDVMNKEYESKEPINGLPKINYFIVVEDPFMLTPWNCAKTVKQRDIFNRIQEEFALAFRNILERRTIFTNEKSNWRIRMEQEGKERDLQILEIHRVFWSGREIRQTPDIFWNEVRNRKNNYVPWPEVCNCPPDLLMYC